MRSMTTRRFVVLFGLCVLVQPSALRGQQAMSHPPLRTAPPPAKRAMAAGPAHFVDARRGDDKAPGTTERPWRHDRPCHHPVARGDTLYLRDGTYYERLYVALAGAEKSPITMRSYPGEQAIIDGGSGRVLRLAADGLGAVLRAARAGEYRSKPAIRTSATSLGRSATR